MGQAGIFIPFSEMENHPSLKAALLAYVAEHLGAPANATGAEARPDTEGLAQLSVRDANRFLNNCGAKTIKVLEFVVAQDGDFLLSQLQRHMRTKELRGVWTGLTRRVRNVTGDDEAVLLGWSYKAAKDDWRVVMATRSVSSFKTALAERG